MSEHLRKSIQELEDKLKGQFAEVNKTKQAINSLYEILGEHPPYQIGGEDSSQIRSIRPDSFFGKGLATAVGDYLAMREHAVPVKEIMDGILRGGFDFGRAKYPERVLRINLAKNTAKFVSIKGSDSYGLREWYPNLRRDEKTDAEVDLTEAQDNEMIADKLNNSAEKK